jgi:hypothetical protein
VFASRAEHDEVGRGTYPSAAGSARASDAAQSAQPCGERTKALALIAASVLGIGFSLLALIHHDLGRSINWFSASSTAPKRG